MGELFRSEEMLLIQLFVQVEAAHDTFDELGHLGVIQFKDLNQDVNLFQRAFVNEVRRVDEMERKLDFADEQVRLEEEAEDPVPNMEGGEKPAFTINYDEFNHQPTTADEISRLEHRFEELERELQQLNTNQEMLKRNYNELTELRHVLMKDTEFFEQAGDVGGSSESPEALWEEGRATELMPSAPQYIKLGFLTGVISKEKLAIFERILWRSTRGNLYMKQAPISELIEDPHSPGLMVEKYVFIIFYQGSRAQDKIRKICESFSANLYPCPETAHERKELLRQVETRLEDLDVVLQRSIDQRRRVLASIAPSLEDWRVKIIKEKNIYDIMNMCNYDVGRKCLIAEGWCPKYALNSVHASLDAANQRSDAVVPTILNIIKTKEEPPTYFRTNKFTQPFQGIVDAYGMARYREVNPGPYTIISFPFLFGVMFGDIGHGFLLFIFALYLVLKEKSLARVKLNEMIQTCFDGRYLLLVMGLCSIYCGFIYNEFFSIPLNLFGSRWEFTDGSLSGSWNGASTAYPFGVDPAWKGARNELTFYNSLKMKISVIFGVAQMCFGILLSLINGIYFKKPYNIYFEFIPQMCFMLSIFGYMCYLIFLKWCIPFVELGKVPPYLLNLMIDMFLRPTDLPEENKLFPGQMEVQWLLILIAFISVPLMLLPKPLLLRRDHNNHKKGYTALPDHGEEVDDSFDADTEEEFDFGEVFIHQIIHTIEFVLGAISNTASYLRLWALSLAHSELATVFWERVFVLGWEVSPHYSFITGFVTFAIWAGATFAVLMVMESLSAFLHALRLHWVEFQNKFYAGDGTKFVPFSFRRLLSGVEE